MLDTILILFSEERAKSKNKSIKVVPTIKKSNLFQGLWKYALKPNEYSLRTASKT